MYPISQLILNLDRMLGIDVKNPEADWLTLSPPSPKKRNSGFTDWFEISKGLLVNPLSPSGDKK